MSSNTLHASDPATIDEVRAALHCVVRETEHSENERMMLEGEGAVVTGGDPRIGERHHPRLRSRPLPLCPAQAMSAERDTSAFRSYTAPVREPPTGAAGPRPSRCTRCWRSIEVLPRVSVRQWVLSCPTRSATVVVSMCGLGYLDA